MTRITQRFFLLAGVAVIAITLAGQVRAMGIDEPAKPAAAPADKKDEKKDDAKAAADSKARTPSPPMPSLRTPSLPTRNPISISATATSLPMTRSTRGRIMRAPS